MYIKANNKQTNMSFKHYLYFHLFYDLCENVTKKLENFSGIITECDTIHSKLCKFSIDYGNISVKL